MSEAFLIGLLRANLALAVAVLVVLAVRKAVRRTFGAQAAYGLWAAPLLAAAASWLPAPAATVLSPVVLSAAKAATGALARPSAPAAGGAMLWLWALGAAAAAFLLVARQKRFLAEVKAGRAGPAVIGVLAPRIVVPADFADRFDPAERAVILTHEQTHLARGDAVTNAVAAAIQCLCWFNPLAHLGARTMRMDQELACDAAVLTRHPDKRRLYAEALLKTQLAVQSLPLGCHWPARAQHPLKERIAMLKSPLPAGARRSLGATLVAALGLGAAAVAWAAQAPAPAPAVLTQPDWIERPTGADLARLYPAEAAKQHLNGRALIGCRVTADGRLDACQVLGETPAGAGFGEAALALSQTFRMKPASRDGRPVAGGQVRIPILFSLPQA